MSTLTVPKPRDLEALDDSPGINGYGWHPLVTQFPMMDLAALRRLAEKIETAGGSAPFLKVGHQIIDDRNRLKACQIARIKIDLREWSSDFDSLAETVAALNLPALHLEQSQRAAIAVPVADALAEEVKRNSLKGLRQGKSTSVTQFLAKWPDGANLRPTKSPKTVSDKLGSENSGRASQRAAEICGVSYRYVEQAKSIRDEFPDLFTELRLGRLNLNQANVQIQKMRRAKNLVPPKSAITPAAGTVDIQIGDCLKLMPSIKRGSVDLIFADPPYNNGSTYDSDPTLDVLSEEQYHRWCDRWMRQCAGLLSDTGSMFVMIDGKWQGRFDGMLRAAGLQWRNTIVWYDSFPNHTDANFQPAARFIHYFTASEKDFVFNADAVRIESARDRLGDTRRPHEKGIVPHNVWPLPRIPGNSGERVPFDDAPPQVPDAILRRCILAASNPGDLVLDPFMGNGTTGRAAVALGRNFVGIERSAKYAAQAASWIKAGGNAGN